MIHTHRIERPYTQVISLGGNCRPSYQIERHFCVDDAYPFDRWITSLDGLALYLETLSKDVYEPADLAPILDDGVVVGLLNKRYHFHFYHEFPMTEGNGKSELLPDWNCLVPDATSRIVHLTKKFFDLDRPSNHILFVRLDDWVSGKPLSGGILDSADAFARVLAGLEARLPSAGFDVLCVNFSQHYSSQTRGEIIHVNIADPPGDWRGSNELWSGAFEQIGARLVGKPVS